ncbi:unnamed protein product [Parnassius apollo]|uniref:(apollo) hypothetical protein n=1 Tax=Parnassius apollo TaxID=110799 RepID=A0A8S3X2W8_PARAO|nr:unnamed protein product [Parnassius apollo]
MAQYEQGGEESYSWGSTTYATLATSAGRSPPVQTTNPYGLPQDDGQWPSTSYAHMVATPVVPRPQAAVEPADQEKARYPPIVAECLLDWTRHFKELNRKLGHPPNARPFGKGVRFTPQSADEFCTIQRYMVELSKEIPSLTWYCYTPEEDKPTKVGIRGLPMGTDTKTIEEAIRAKGFKYVKAIPPRRGRPGCLYFAQLDHLSLEQLQDLYKTVELLYMRGVVIKAWRRKAGPAQCHRCQAFGHASANCFRSVKCVRCAGEHIASLCPRDREEELKCANCGKNHTANDRRCPVLRRTARRQGITLPGLVPEDPKKIPQSRARAVTIQEDGWATVTGKERQTSRRRKRTRSKKKSQTPQAVTSTPTPVGPVASQAQFTSEAPKKSVGRVPERAQSENIARSTQKQRLHNQDQRPRPVPTSSERRTSIAGFETAAIQRLVGIAIEVGSQVLADIRAGTDPITVVMKALANLLARHYRGERDEVTSQGAAYRGTAVLVRRDIVHQELELPVYQTMRSIGIKMEAAGEELRIYAAYRPPGTPFCSSDVRTVMEGETPTIIAGDLNAKHPAWGSRVINPPGHELYEDAERYSYDVLGPEEPTHVPTDPRKRPDVLDIVLSRNVNYPIVVEVL